MPRKIDPHDPPPGFNPNKITRIYLTPLIQETIGEKLRKELLTVFPKVKILPYNDSNKLDFNYGQYPKYIGLYATVRDWTYDNKKIGGVYYTGHWWAVSDEWVSEEFLRNMQRNLDFIANL